MSNADERMKILQLLQDGKITAAQAAQLLEAVATSATGPGSAHSSPNAPYPPSTSAGQGRWLRVRVTDTDTGKNRVNVRLPLNLVSSGIKMGMRFAPEVEGLNIDELTSFIQSGEVGQIVDVYDEKDGEHVEVYIE